MSNNHYERTKASYDKLFPVIDKIHDAIKMIPEEKLLKPHFRRYGKEPSTADAYVTLLMVDEVYLPGVLTLGYSLRKHGVKNDLVCLVQDKSTEFVVDGEKKTYPGVSAKGIEDILGVYDVVYGVNLLKVEDYKVSNNHFTKMEHYKNISVYVTKLQILGITDYEKIFYMDASSIAMRNLDYLFKFYKDKSAYIMDNVAKDSKYGLRGAPLMIVTSLRQYNQGLYLFKNYNKIFGDFYMMRGVDEQLLYFAVYPNWDYDNLLKQKLSCNSHKQHFNCPIYIFQIQKPWRKGPNDIEDRYKQYNQWDDLSCEFMDKYPQYTHYYEHIKDFRTFPMHAAHN